MAKLLETGINPEKIYDEVYNIVPFNKMKLFGEGYSSMELFYDGKLCIAALTTEQMKRTHTSTSDTENFVESLLSITGVKVGILISEIPGVEEMRLSFRSKAGLNIRTLANRFGGGGHDQAAGARVFGSNLWDIKRQVIEAAADLFK